ncbi:MAG: gene transfer agent family protein [Mesorhizobium sp.]
MTVTAFLGDGEHAFALPYPLIEELQRTTGASIGVLFTRVRTLAFAIGDIAETIRLGLIGGGLTPEAAFQLVETYVKPRPLAETLPVAMSILEVVWFGTPADQPSGDQTGEADHG